MEQKYYITKSGNKMTFEDFMVHELTELRQSNTDTVMSVLRIEDKLNGNDFSIGITQIVKELHDANIHTRLKEAEEITQWIKTKKGIAFGVTIGIGFMIGIMTGIIKGFAWVYEHLFKS